MSLGINCSQKDAHAGGGLKRDVGPYFKLILVFYPDILAGIVTSRDCPASGKRENDDGTERQEDPGELGGCEL